ncbi:hypothetical protein [Pseudomonas phage vB_Pae_SG_WM_Sew_P27]
MPCYRQGGGLVAPLAQLFFSAVVRVVFGSIRFVPANACRIPCKAPVFPAIATNSAVEIHGVTQFPDERFHLCLLLPYGVSRSALQGVLTSSMPLLRRASEKSVFLPRSPNWASTTRGWCCPHHCR